MRTLYLVRHGEKAWKNGKKPAGATGGNHDPPLKGGDSLASTKEALREVQFDHVYCSPFLRCRQTLEELKRENAIIDPFIGEYLGNQRSHTLPELDLTTLSHYKNPVVLKQLTTESIKRLQFRVRKFLDALPKEGKILIISHGIVLRQICGQEIPEGGLVIS